MLQRKRQSDNSELFFNKSVSQQGPQISRSVLESDESEVMTDSDDAKQYMEDNEESSEMESTFGSSHNKHHKKNKAERVFERKYQRYKEKNEFELFGLQEWEKFEAFRSSKDPLGRKRGDTKWFKDYLNITRKSGATWWDVSTRETTKVIDVPGDGDGGTGSMDKEIDIGVSSGRLTVTYDMRSVPDRMRITNPVNGKVIFDTRKKVANKGDSGGPRKFDLGDGNTKLRIEINPGDFTEGSQFDYKISIQSSGGGQNVIVNHVPNTKGEKKKYN